MRQVFFDWRSRLSARLGQFTILVLESHQVLGRWRQYVSQCAVQQVHGDPFVAFLASIFLDGSLGHGLGERRGPEDELQGVIIPVQRILLEFFQHGYVERSRVGRADDEQVGWDQTH